MKQMNTLRETLGFDDTELEVISRYLDTTHVRFGGDP